MEDILQGPGLLPPNWLEYHVSTYLQNVSCKARVISKARSWFQILIQIQIQNL